MDKREDLLRATLRNYSIGARRRITEHVSVEELEQFTSGSLPEERLEVVRDHIAVCPLCLADTLDRRTFPIVKFSDDVPQLSDKQVEERWRKMRRALVLREFPKPELPSGPLVQRSRRQSIRMTGAVAAAAIFLAISSFRLLSGFWAGGAPSVNTQIVSLLPEGSGPGTVTRGTAGTVSISAVADSVLLVLNVVSLSDFSTYRIDLIEAGQEKPRWSDSSIQPTQGMSFTVSFPKAELPANSYLVQLWGGEDSHLQLIAQYHFRVAYEE